MEIIMEVIEFIQSFIVISNSYLWNIAKDKLWMNQKHVQNKRTVSFVRKND